jgi:hypothetical protein
LANEDIRKLKLSAVREAAIIDELNSAAQNYRERRAAFEIERQRYEASLQSFIAVRRLADEVLPGVDYLTWENENPDVAMVGMDVGAAILAVLRTRAYQSAHEAAQDPKVSYRPRMSSWEISRVLDEQGFPFKTSTPRREVHAALLHLKGVKRDMGGGRRTQDGSGMSYAIDRADGIAQDTKAHYERIRERERREASE